MSAKIAFVSGAARGIGFNIAQRLARDGMHVYCGDKDKDALTRAVDTLTKQGYIAHPVIGDLAAPMGGAAMVDEVLAVAKRLDVVVNNARAGSRRDMLDEDESNWDLTFTTVLKAPYFLSQRAIHHMIAQKIGGVVINIGSIAGDFITGDLSPSYHIAKAGLRHMTRYLAALAGAHGIRVNAIIPGFIVKDEHRDRFEADDNELYRQKAVDHIPLRRVGTSDDVANAVSFLCSSESSFITGQGLVIDGGSTLWEQWSLVDPTKS
ncbi:MAG: SDR family oxidoreductase [Alphaproteobacteria bacterium]|nr:SDR family oxidoreductase [Alphaproteobacteria bacterium]